MIITREKDGIFQTYCSPDIYGKGKWKTNQERSILDVPRFFDYEPEARFYIQNAQEKEPDWEYHIDFYDR